MTNLFKHSSHNPFHISVGAVLVNAEGKICAHKAKTHLFPSAAQQAVPALSEIYILMRESLEDSETLEDAVLRGLREEFGCEGKIMRYLGSIQGVAYGRQNSDRFEKTTLYFEVTLTRAGERPEDDAEAFTSLVWLEPQELIVHMRHQRNEMRDDLDESKVIEAYLEYGN